MNKAVEKPSANFKEKIKALTAVLVILEDFADVAGVHKTKELLEQIQSKKKKKKWWVRVT